jgi:hypothetical protein
MTTDPAELREAGQMRSLFAVSDTTRQDFERILRLAPVEFSSNDIREYMDLAQIPESARGGLFAAAVKAGWIVPLMVQGYPARVPSTGPSAHTATVRVYRRCAA